MYIHRGAYVLYSAIFPPHRITQCVFIDWMFDTITASTVNLYFILNFVITFTHIVDSTARMLSDYDTEYNS